MSNLTADGLAYSEDRHFEDGFNEVYCKCGAHLSDHANRSRGTPHEKFIDRTQWFCPMNPPREQSLLDIAIGMLK